MRKELQQKHHDHEEVLQWIQRLWDILDNIHELLISKIFSQMERTAVNLAQYVYQGTLLVSCLVFNVYP